MDESNNRIIRRDNIPGASEIEEWVEREAFRYWKQITQLIDWNYPKVFTP
jgi:hypothetical protein